MALSASARSVLGVIERLAAAGQNFVRNTGSTAIRRIGFNPLTGTMGLVFTKRNTQYLYPDVPFDIIARFMASRSKGKFYHTHIKNQYGLGG
jgi:hypothetical protein